MCDTEHPTRRALILAALSLPLAGCGLSLPGLGGPRTVASLDHTLKGDQLPPPAFRRTVVDYAAAYAPGSIVIETEQKFLYLVQPGGRAIRYGVGVGRQGFGWKGLVNVRGKREWPEWYPPREMIARERANGRNIPDHMAGGPDNPLGARAMYLWQGNHDTLYRIHGTREPHTIGTNVSSGCIRLANNDVMDLYDRVEIGAPVIVR